MSRLQGVAELDRPIRELSDLVAAQIAAGEVVERPSAALKELLENAADAGAGRIAVEITAAGRERIAVHDDGRGIAESQLQLAFRRHATSKLERAEDLAGLTSYGFRGEALPAIAAAAGRLRMVSRARGAERAAAIEFEDGREGPVRPAARAVGTSVELDDLFANQPARRAFLAGPRAERAALLRVATDAVLAHPEASLRVTIDGREPLAHEARAGDGEAALRHGLASVFSERAAGRALWIAASSERGAVALDGFCGLAEDARGTRDGLRLFVNGRPVQDRRLAYAVQEAYRDWIPGGRFPLAVVRLTTPPEAVDVNIHPAKTEVKLRDHDLAFGLLQRTIRDALSRERFAAPPMVRPRTLLGSGADQVDPPARSGAAQDGTRDETRSAGQYADPRMALPWREPRAASVAEPSLASWRRAELPGADAGHAAGAGQAADAGQAAGVGRTAEFGGPEPIRRGLPPLRMVGQLHRTFIIAEGPEGLVLIDQHGAHERVLYERLLAQSRQPAAARQPLLSPLLLPLDAVETANWSAAAERLDELGFSADAFGERTLRLRAVPAALDAADAETLIRGLLADLGPAPDEPERFDRAAASAACHASVRRGAALDPPAMTALLRDLERTEQPHTCPHGRPTLVEISADEVLRQFRRK